MKKFVTLIMILAGVALVAGCGTTGSADKSCTGKKIVCDGCKKQPCCNKAKTKTTCPKCGKLLTECACKK